MLRWGRRSYEIGEWEGVPLFVSFRFVDLLWVIAFGWDRRYLAGGQVVSRSEVESEAGNKMPLRYRFGWLILVPFALLAIVH